ncbi:hypothetical protein Tco_1159286, partial [Tanacetum coccineum]
MSKCRRGVLDMRFTALSDKDDNESDIKEEQNTGNGSNNKDYGEACGNKDKSKSYASMVKKDEVFINKNLIFIEPKITEDEDVKVLFHENI